MIYRFIRHTLLTAFLGFILTTSSIFGQAVPADISLTRFSDLELVSPFSINSTTGVISPALSPAFRDLSAFIQVRNANVVDKATVFFVIDPQPGNPIALVGYRIARNYNTGHQKYYIISRKLSASNISAWSSTIPPIGAAPNYLDTTAAVPFAIINPNAVSSIISDFHIRITVPNSDPAFNDTPVTNFTAGETLEDRITAKLYFRSRVDGRDTYLRDVTFYVRLPVILESVLNITGGLASGGTIDLGTLRQSQLRDFTLRITGTASTVLKVSSARGALKHSLNPIDVVENIPYQINIRGGSSGSLVNFTATFSTGVPTAIGLEPSSSAFNPGAGVTYVCKIATDPVPGVSLGADYRTKVSGTYSDVLTITVTAL